jgi:hypothetical protein
MIRLFLTSIIFFITAAAFAQQTSSQKQSRKAERKQRINALAKQEEEGVIAYPKHTIFGGKLNSDGYGLFLEIGRARSIARSWLFQLEITERKHPKEEKQNNPFVPTAPIIYGKENFFYPVKMGMQQQFLLGNKSNKNGVSVTANIGGGLCIGLLRPYKLEVDKDGQRAFVKYESDSLLFLNGPYYGGPNFGTGWDDLKVTPGIYLKPAFRFDYGRYNEIVSAVEVGLVAEFYSKKIPQMIFNKQQQFFFSAYVAVMFGQRK